MGVHGLIAEMTALGPVLLQGLAMGRAVKNNRLIDNVGWDNQVITDIIVAVALVYAWHCCIYISSIKFDRQSDILHTVSNLL